MKRDLLKVVNLTKSFGGVRAVDAVSFEVAEGEFLGLIGPNGSGKTTTVNLITGYVKPDKGKVFFKGKDITGKAPYAIANIGIARSFQMVRPLYQLPAFKNIVVALRSPRVMKEIRGGKYGELDDVAIDLLEDVGFERDSFVPYKLASALPHGYLKRMELARCMALRPDLYILDELFSGMSMSEVAATLFIIEKMKQGGKTVIMIEHRLRELFRVADRVLVLNFGRKIAEGTPKEISESDEVKKAYIGVEVELA